MSWPKTMCLVDAERRRARRTLWASQLEAPLVALRSITLFVTHSPVCSVHLQVRVGEQEERRCHHRQVRVGHRGDEDQLERQHGQPWDEGRNSGKGCSEALCRNAYKRKAGVRTRKR